MLTSHPPALTGAGLGLRRSLLSELQGLPDGRVDFMEVAPENWIGVGGRFGRQFRELAERFPMALHGLSLNLGGEMPLDRELIRAIKDFMGAFGCPVYSEHLSYCADAGHLYDLMPIPFTEEAVAHVARRIRQVQDELGQRIAIENVSYYLQHPDDGEAVLSESDFIGAVVAAADCDLLLDVNNIYVNSINHDYDPHQFLRALPLERVRYIHVAGHYEQAPDLRVDTHGAPVIDPVWSLLGEAYTLCGPLPTLLERDFNFPPMSDLLAEVDAIRQRQRRAADTARRVSA